MRGCIMLMLVISTSAVGAEKAQTAGYRSSDYLPLVVGNSWVYRHEASDTEDGVMGLGQGVYDEITVSIDTTKVIGGKTYYVFSDMPAGAPAPPHCIVGKKVRWDGHRLMEHTGSGEVSIFQFDPNRTTYTILDTHGDTAVEVILREEDAGYPSGRPPFRAFEFTGYDGYDQWKSLEPGRSASRQVKFVAAFGMGSCGEWLKGADYGAAFNVLYAVRATLRPPPSQDGMGSLTKGTDSTRPPPDPVTKSYWDARFPDRAPDSE